MNLKDQYRYITKIKHFEKNVKGRDFYVGDIHGEYDKFMNQLTKVNFDYENDRVFSVGDLIDRGPKSFECLKLIYEPWFHCVLGNHEQMMIDQFCNFVGLHMWVINGGSWHFEYEDELKEIAEYLNEHGNQLMIIDNSIAVVHAEIYGDINDDHDLQKSIWGRTRWHRAEQNELDFVTNIKCVVSGHTPAKFPLVKKNNINIDLGLVYTKDKECNLFTEQQLLSLINTNKDGSE